ncbi:MAG: hypothetical protein GY867_07235 [bacterium]|nr:hypothetical protein [bacterium]
MTVQPLSSEGEFKKAKILAFAILVAAPLIYLLVAAFLDREMFATEGVSDMLAYMLLVVAMVQGGLVKVIERFQIQSYRRNPQPSATPAQFFVSVSIVTMAMIESAFLLGLVVFLLTGDYLHLLRFYIIGAAWAVFCWPRRAKFNEFIEKLQTK